MAQNEDNEEDEDDIEDEDEYIMTESQTKLSNFIGLVNSPQELAKTQALIE
jgi:hypothetical protein